MWDITGGNGHYYEYVYNPGLTWHQACTAAESSSYAGYYGHLITITSAAEQEFIESEFSSISYLESWLGAWQEEGALTDEKWHWVTNESWSYSNWAPMEPNDKNGDQRYLMMWGDQANNADRWWKWGDDHADTDLLWNQGYFVEYSVPEPSVMFNLLMAVGCLIVRRKG